MASLIKREGSPFYFCSYRAGDGRWLKKSTKTKDKATALRICVEWDSASASARKGNLTAAQARKVLAEMVAISSGESLSEFSVESWFQQWLDSKAGSATASTMARYKQVTRDFLLGLSTRAKGPLAGITPGDITLYRDTLRKEGRSIGTCNVTVKILGVPFESARKQGYIPNNPASAVDALKNRKESKESSREPFTLAELQSLIAASSGDWLGLITLAATTGLRLGDAARLVWSSVELEVGLLRVETQKTGADVVLPIHPDLSAWLAKAPRGIGKAPVFPNLAGLPVGGRNGLSAGFASIMKKANVLPRAVEREGKGRTTYSKGFHSLRHTFVSGLANAGVAADLRQKLAGHADAKVHAGYTHHEIETLRAAVAKLPSLKAV